MSVPQSPIIKPRRGDLTVIELAAYLGVTRQTIYTALRRERIVFGECEIIYTPAPRGKPRKDQR